MLIGNIVFAPGMRFVLSGFLIGANQDCRQLLIPSHVRAFEIDEIGSYGQNIFIMTDLPENLAYLTHLVRADKANEEIREVAE